MIRELILCSAIFVVGSGIAMENYSDNETYKCDVKFDSIGKSENDDEIVYFGDSTVQRPWSQESDLVDWICKKNKHTNIIECKYSIYFSDIRAFGPSGIVPEKFFMYIMEQYNQRYNHNQQKKR